jgi:ribosomal protein S18 acetylase RimI-like enzyme
MEDVCIRTADQGHEPRPARAFPQFLSDIWLTPYMRQDAATVCFVAREDGLGGKVIGYCIAALDAHTFEESLAKEWYPSIRGKYLSRVHEFTPADRGLWKLISSPVPVHSDWLKYYPAEVHIDILPDGQGLGVGRRLMSAMTKELQKRGVKGFFLGVDPLNTNAQGFYKHMGFVTIVPRGAGGPIYGVSLKKDAVSS